MERHFLKAGRRLEKKKPSWITLLGKLAFLVKWFIMEKKDFKKGLNEIREED